MRLNGKGFVHSRVLYSRDPEFRQALFSCIEAGDPTPHRLTFFSAYPLGVRLAGVPEDEMKGGWQNLVFPIEPTILDAAVHVDRCLSVFNALDRRLSVPGRPLLWQGEIIGEGVFREVLDDTATLGRVEMARVMLRIDDRTRIQIGPGNFIPQLRRKLAVENPDGSLLGATFTIRID
jgi:hypothetical protein